MRRAEEKLESKMERQKRDLSNDLTVPFFTSPRQSPDLNPATGRQTR